MTRYRRIIAIAIAAAAATGASSAAAAYALADSPAPAAHAAHTISAPSAPATLDPQVVVRDASGNEILAVQLQLGVRDTGAFDFSVANVGTWAGVIPVHQASPYVSHLSGEVTATFQAAGASTTAAATIRIAGVIDQARNVAVVGFWTTRPGKLGVAHYLLRTARPDVLFAPGIARYAGLVLWTENWSALYRIAASDIRQNYSEAQFIKAVSSQHEPKLHKLRFTGPGKINVAAGITYFAQPYSFTVIAQNGSVATYTANILLTWEQYAWRFAGTTQPQASSS